MRFIHFALVLLLLSGLPVLSSADRQPGKDQPRESKKPSLEEIDRLVRQLGDDKFAKRHQARKQLEAIGEPAIGILKKAAESSEDVEIRLAARAIIERIELKNSGLLRCSDKQLPIFPATPLPGCLGDGRKKTKKTDRELRGNGADLRIRE